MTSTSTPVSGLREGMLLSGKFLDPRILDTKPWIVKAESYQHALGFREIFHAGSEQVLGRTFCETRRAESLAH